MGYGHITAGALQMMKPGYPRALFQSAYADQGSFLHSQVIDDFMNRHQVFNAGR